MAQNLIRLVDGVECPCPSSFTWILSDSSASDAGRVLDGNDTMYKNRTSQKRKIELKWNAKSPEVVSEILKMFNPEYIEVTYWDSMDGCEETRTFYVGDRQTPVQQWFIGGKMYSSLSLNIIER